MTWIIVRLGALLPLLFLLAECQRNCTKCLLG